jgi:hypothetical protein
MSIRVERPILFPIPPRRMTRISMSFPGLKQYVLIENKKV